MKHKGRKGKKLSRRGVLPLLGGTLMLPFLGLGNERVPDTGSPEDEELHTLLKPDGSIVKVKASTLKKSKVVHKKLSNKSFLNWLEKKF